MKTLIPNFPTSITPIIYPTIIHNKPAKLCANYRFSAHRKLGVEFHKLTGKFACSSDGGEVEQNLLQELRVPSHWLEPSKASEESEWLRATLHKWLDEEYCPEPTNIEISKVAAKSFYESMVGNRSDLGEILLRMALELESISYQESFHGAFSSANAAVNLIVQRVLAE